MTGAPDPASSPGDPARSPAAPAAPAAPVASGAERLFTPLLDYDASGRTWLPALLSAAPRGREHLGELVDDPGSLSMTLAVRGADGRLGAFTYPSAAPPALSRWFIEHPERLTWPEDPDAPELSKEATRLLRMLLHDDPPGSQAPAQERAIELLRSRSILSREWWRFEPTTLLGCVLMTPRLVLTVTTVDADTDTEAGAQTDTGANTDGDAAAAAPLVPSTPWFPARTALVRDLESARALADGLPFGTLVLAGSDAVANALEGQPDRITQAIEAGTPHLDALDRSELADAYLGAVTLAAAARAIEKVQSQ